MNIIAYDTETKGFEWFAGQTAFIATTADAEREWVYNLADEDEQREFEQQLKRADVIVAHNLSFDVHQVRATTGFDILTCDAELHDTDIMARIYWPEGTYGEHGGFGLKALAKVYLDPDADVDEQGIKDAGKAMGMRSLNKTGAYYDVWRAYPDVMEKYAMSDARYTYDLYQLLLKDHSAAFYNGDGRYAIYNLERQIIPILIRAEAEGAPVDRDKVAKLHRVYKKREKQQRAALADDLGEDALDGDGSQEKLAAALLKQGVPLVETTETGKLATNKFALQPFAKDHPIIERLQDYRQTEKFLSTYIEPLHERDTVHPNFRQIGTWTGRMSCVRPNMQNIPVRSGKEVRDVFTAPEGYTLVVSDYDGIEMRLLAYYLGREGTDYRQMIAEGHDAHSWMASKLHGGDPADYAKGTPGEDLRATAKNTLFAIVYGAGGRRLCDMNNLPTGPPLTANDWMVRNGFGEEGGPSYAEGRALASQVKRAIPGYNSLMRRVRAKIEAHGYVTTLMGRKQAVAREKSYVGMSALIQGSAADVMKSGILAVQRRFDELAWDEYPRMVLFVHDEVVTLCTEEAAETVAAHQADALRSAYDLDPPLVVSTSIAQSYGEAK